MPWTSVDELRKSDLFKGSAMLQKMGSQKLKAFLEIFNRVHLRAKRGGATDEQAELRALPIALVGARAATVMPANRTVEKDVAVFSLYAEDMAHGAGADTSMNFPPIEDVNDVMAGQVFFGPYTHDRLLAEPQGVIHRVMRRADLPETLRAKVDPDILIVAEASFFADVPSAERFATISPEWDTVRVSNGEEIHIPTNFIITNNPANDKLMGIGRVAQRPSGNAYEQDEGLSGTRDTMPATVEELQAKVANLQKQADASKENATKAEEAEQKFATLKQTYEDFVTKVASLAGKAPANGEKPNPDAIVIAFQNRIASLETDVVTMKTKAAQAEADAWADKVVKSKEIAMDAKPKMASLYLTAKQAALDIEASLPERVNKPGQSDANLNVEKLEGKAAEEALAFVAEAFNPKGAK